MNISIVERVGTDPSNRRTAAALRAEVLASVSGFARVTIDFHGVRTVSESFADELFAVLVEENSPEWFREHLHVVNASATIRETILETIADRLSGEFA